MKNLSIIFSLTTPRLKHGPERGKVKNKKQ